MEIIDIIEEIPQKNNRPSLRLPELSTCIILDIIGYLTYILPIFGETFDLIWAPFSAYILYRLFGNQSVRFAYTQFAEELLPGILDFIPTFTITWIYFKYVKKK